MGLAAIESIEQLKKSLNLGPGYGGYNELIKAIQIPHSEWEKNYLWKDENYTRNCISSCDGYELILMCWKEKQASPIHSYDFQEGWIKVLEGELTIETYQVDQETKDYRLQEAMRIAEGESTYLNDNMGYHRVVNSKKGNTTSLHLHIEKVNQWTVLDEEKHEFQNFKPQFDSKSPDCE